MIKQSLLKEIKGLELDELMLLSNYIMDVRSDKGRNTMSVGSEVYVVQKTKKTKGVIISIGTKFNCSKLLDKMPMMNPNKLKVIQFISRRTSIHTG